MLVRHAEAVAPSDPRYEENDRPLADGGRREAAERLADELAAEAVAAIYSSPYPRAVQTVEPLARRMGARDQPGRRPARAAALATRTAGLA